MKECLLMGHVQHLMKKKFKKHVNFLLKKGVTSIAVCLINAYANNKHEKNIEKLLRDFGFKGYISCHQLFLENIENMKGTTTTVIDSFVRQGMSNYLNSLRDELKN